MDGKELLIIFAKAPIAGLVKTRMFPYLSFDEAAELQGAFLSDIVELALADTGRNTCVAYTPRESLGVFMNMFPSPDVEFHAQEGDDLGARMDNAFRCAFEMGYAKAVIVGSDIPTMSREHIDEAFDALGSNDISICPTQDGGYCILGLKKPVPGLFRGIPWSTPRAFEATLARAAELKLKVHVLRTLSDVDTYDDLLRIKGVELPDNTGKVIERLRPKLEGGSGWLL